MRRAVLTVAVAIMLGIWTARVIGDMLTGNLGPLERAYIALSLAGWYAFLVVWVGGGFEQNQ